MIKKETKIKIGIELECSIPTNRIYISSYHSYRNHKKFLWFESDGSIRPYNGLYVPVEIISKPFYSNKIGFYVGLLKRIAQKYSGTEVEFSDFYKINNSCGCHINFSYENENFQIDKVYFYSLTKIFFKLLEKSNLNKDIKRAIKKQYFRDYASFDYGLDRRVCLNTHQDRYEWRSFNLMGIRTFEDLKEILQIAIETIKIFYENNLSKEIYDLPFYKNKNMLQKEIIIVNTINTKNDIDNIIEIKTIKKRL